MASNMSNLEVFNQWAYTANTEAIDQNIQIFNQASQGTILLQPQTFPGDYYDTQYWVWTPDLILSRSPYADATTTIESVEMKQDKTTQVKFGSSTKELRLTPSTMDWIKRNPQEAGTVFGKQLAEQQLAYKVNMAISILKACIGKVATLNRATTATPTNTDLLRTRGLFGDRMNKIAAWVMSSMTWIELLALGLSNAERLFTWQNVTFYRDQFGTLFVVTDSPALYDSTVDSGTTTTVYTVLGLAPGSLFMGRDEDREMFQSETTNLANNVRTQSLEWTNTVQVNGFAWAPSTPVQGPTPADLEKAANWTQKATFTKDLPGVMLTSTITSS
jgi:hypothetical protein